MIKYDVGEFGCVCFFTFAQKVLTYCMVVDFVVCLLLTQGVTALSVDRCLAVLFPIQYRKYDSQRKSVIVLIAVIVYANILLVPIFVYYMVLPPYKSTECFVNPETKWLIPL